MFSLVNVCFRCVTFYSSPNNSHIKLSSRAWRTTKLSDHFCDVSFTLTLVFCIQIWPRGEGGERHVHMSLRFSGKLPPGAAVDKINIHMFYCLAFPPCVFSVLGVILLYSLHTRMTLGPE
jgi:hypothetical protein